ncbi:MAG: succinylglutamate desuccinylase/aspartoacylase family protein [Pseudomonadota bacterium]
MPAVLQAALAAPVPHPVQTLPPRLARWAGAACGVPYVHERCAPVTRAPGPEILVTALVHGNEYSGAIALGELLASGWLPARGRVTGAFCNIAAFDRFDVQQPDASRFVDEDFNRVWSTQLLDSNRQSAELDRARELRPFVDRASHLLDLHSMHEPCAPLLVTGTLQRNIDFAQSLRTASQVVVDSGHADGVRMRDYGAFADEKGERIALLLEAGQHWDLRAVSAARDTLMRFLIRAGACDRAEAPPGWLLPDATPPAPIEVTDRVVAQSMDFEFVQPFTGGETIAHAGTVIARDGDQNIVTPCDDCVLVMPSLRQLRPGVTTVRLGRRMAPVNLL